MKRKIIYALRTQNELSDLIPNIEAVLPYVDHVVCLDGGSKDLTIPYMRNWSNKEPKIYFAIDIWRDDFPAARNAYLKKATDFADENTWLLTADPDEHFMPETLGKLQKVIEVAEARGANMIGFQCRSVSLEGPVRVWENLDEYWKHLLIKWDPNFRYTGNLCHEGKGGIPHNILNTGLIYEHRKQNNIIHLRGMRNLFTGGGGPNLGDANPAWKELKQAAALSIKGSTDNGYVSWHELYDYLIKGNIAEPLKQFMINHMFDGMSNAGPNSNTGRWPDKFPVGWDGASEHRECYKAYFRLLHPEEEPVEFRGVHIE